MSQELQGKTALLTGASRGIGAAAALALARQGVSRFLLHYNSNRTGLEETLQALRAEGAEAAAVQADLGEVAGIHALIDAVKQADQPIDILVNNAGSLVQRAKLPEFTEELYDRVMNLNVKSAWFLTQAVAPSMIERGSGAIVNVSSIAARNGGGPGATIYAAAKAALSCITKGLSKELAPRGIRVNAVSPGTVDNHFHAQFSSAQMLEAMRASTPAGTLGTNEEVADAIVFLCSHAARYIHGQTLEINGGMFMV
ncbi:MAG: SDR family oxidoreductase [Candidatus Solibacter usitatus]|nr:SDR family oxidoreductase [Candidatus Solibacter usitatus]